jgi:Zn-dependent M28 family amino/carboxypeptidase
MELARVVGKRFPQGFDASIAFVLYTGEELGLLGSTVFAERLKREGKTVTAAFTDDIIGNVVAEDGRVDSMSVRVFAVDSLALGGSELARYVWGIGAVYQPAFEVVPVLRLDRLGRGGDHAPFHRQGLPALRFSERLENYKRQHLGTDAVAGKHQQFLVRGHPASPFVPGPLGQRAGASQGWSTRRLVS